MAGARRGPPPQPTKLRLVRGNPGKRPIPENEPQPKPGATMPPDLSKKAQKVWAIVSAQLEKAGVLTEMDVQALSAFCENYATWREATDHIRSTKKGGGLVTRTALGFYVQSPYLSIANKSQEQMVALLREFGMTPSSRTRVKTSKPEEDDDFGQIRDASAR
jgi:P27 family predicted phage terminase small subunit